MQLIDFITDLMEVEGEEPIRYISFLKLSLMISIFVNLVLLMALVLSNVVYFGHFNCNHL